MTGVVVAALSAGAWAEGWLAGEFSRIDADHDGRLTAAEAATRAKELAGADTDGDSVLTFDEVQRHVRQNVGRRLRESLIPEAMETYFKKLDADGDGRLSGPETTRMAWLQALDADNDGAVALSEIKAIYADEAIRPPTETISPLDQPPPVFDSGVRLGQGPRPLKPADHGIARRLPDLEVETPDRGTVRLSTLAGKIGTVMALVSPSCPVGKRYLPELARLSTAFTARGFGFVYVEVDAPLTAETIKDAGLVGVAVRDPKRALRQALGARSTTEVFVIDGARTLVYRGAIDDRYGVGYSRDEARVRPLTDALEAVIGGQAVPVAATDAPGCVLDPVASTAAPGPVTFHNRVSRILQASCQECHRSGGLGPFPLETAAHVGAKAGMIRRMVAEGLMPPWFAAPPPPGHATPWGNDRALSAEDKRDLLDWLAAGRPEGDPADAPLARAWPAGWAIGEPDAVYQIPQPIAVKAEGTMPYQNVIVETHLTEDRWVQAWEVQPTAREVVHHVLVFVRDPSKPVRRGRDEDENAGFFAAYVPGNSRAVYPAGLGKKLPAGAKVRFQIHYTPNGTAMQDQVRVGFRFAAAPPEHVVEVATIAQPRLRIPPGAPAHPEAASVPIPADVRLLGLMPHMHVRGKAFRFEVVLPGGEARTLLDVPRYDFNWQIGYRYAEPLLLPAGSRLRTIGWFDNSAANPANPDPARTVPWGEQTYDEMMIGYAEYYVPSQPIGRISAVQ